MRSAGCFICAHINMMVKPRPAGRVDDGFPGLVKRDAPILMLGEDLSKTVHPPRPLPISTVAGIVAMEILLWICFLAVLALLTGRLPCQGILAFLSTPVPRSVSYPSPLTWKSALSGTETEVDQW